MPNSIVAENLLPGIPQNVWYPAKPSPLIRGFTNEISYNKGEAVTFYVQTPDAANIPYALRVYRLGYYSGNGAREVARFDGRSVEQPPCNQRLAKSVDDEANKKFFPYLIDCGNWQPAWTWESASNIVSGLFMAKLTRVNGFGAWDSSAIFFVIRDDQRDSDILLQTSDTTWNAYSSGPSYQGGPIPSARSMEGRSLYDVNKPRAFKVSYLRPHIFETTDTLETQRHFQQDITTGLVFQYGNEYSLIRFLERNGYDVAYFSGRDSDLRGELIKRHRLFLTSGHDEYWSGRQMDNILAARDAGVHLAFFSGNTAYWKIRWEDDHHTMVCYKEQSPLKLDPQPGVTTGLFRDPGFGPPKCDGYRPENKLTGLLTSRGVQTDSDLCVTEPEGKLRFWRDTSVANLKPGDVATFKNLLGFEIDGDVDNGARPNGLIHLSTTEVMNQQYPSSAIEQGVTTTIHNMTLYRHAARRAFVFHAGTMRLQQALAGFHDGAEQGGDARLQQAIVNLFADMNVQPETLQAGLSPAARTTDQVGPTVSILEPADSAVVKLLDTVTVCGVASDAEGRVAAIEVSIDGGRKWHPAIGQQYWHYSFTPCRQGTLSILARGVDDSGNIGPQAVIKDIEVVPPRINDFVRNGTFTCGFVEMPLARNPVQGSPLARNLGVGSALIGDPGVGPIENFRIAAVKVNLIGKEWCAYANSGRKPELSNAGMVPGINIQRVVTSGDNDGLYQNVTLVPERWYILLAHVFLESGAVVLRIGIQGQADSVVDATQLVGRWQWLKVAYQPPYAASEFVLYSHPGPATFKVDQVILRAV